MRIPVVIAVAVIVLVVVVALLFPAMHTSLRSDTGTATPSNLALTLNLNASRITPGQGIDITADLYYKGNQPILVSTKGPVILPSLYPCSQPLLVGVKVLKGYYTVSNYSSGKSLQVFKPGVYPCPLIFAVTTYRFLPMSDRVQLIYNGTVQATLSDRTSAVVYGYYFPTSPNVSVLDFSAWNFTYFQPGVYTVVAIDYFNQTVFAYFTVT